MYSGETANKNLATSLQYKWAVLYGPFLLVEKMHQMPYRVTVALFVSDQVGRLGLGRLGLGCKKLREFYRYVKNYKASPRFVKKYNPCKFLR